MSESPTGTPGGEQPPVSSSQEYKPSVVITDTGVKSLERRSRVPYSEAVAEEIYDHYISGYTLRAIAEMPGMPAYNTILGWAHNNDEFRKRLRAAGEVRALHFEEKALHAAEEPTFKDDVPAAKLRVDTYQWAAGVNDPERYGKKTTISGDSGRPIVFTVVTGVPQKPEIPVVAEVVGEEESQPK